MSVGWTSQLNTIPEKIENARRLGLYIEGMNEPCPECGNMDFKTWRHWNGEWHAGCAYPCNVSVAAESAEAAIAKWDLVIGKLRVTKETIAALVAKYGERYRRLIESSISWLSLREPEWNLDEPIDREEFIQGLVSRVKK